MLTNMQGIEDGSKVSNEELDDYVDSLFGGDKARAFLKIMKSFEPRLEKSAPSDPETTGFGEPPSVSMKFSMKLALLPFRRPRKRSALSSTRSFPAKASSSSSAQPSGKPGSPTSALQTNR